MSKESEAFERELYEFRLRAYETDMKKCEYTGKSRKIYEKQMKKKWSIYDEQV